MVVGIVNFESGLLGSKGTLEMPADTRMQGAFNGKINKHRPLFRATERVTRAKEVVDLDDSDPLSWGRRGGSGGGAGPDTRGPP